MRQKPSKYHHYVPQGYLRNFLNSDTEILYVLDKQSGEIRESATRAICAENHYNTIVMGDFPPDSVEKIYAEFESKILYGLNSALSSEAEPTSEQLNDILNLTSFLFANSPRRRQTYTMAKAGEAKILEDLSSAGIGEFDPSEFFDKNKSRAEMISVTLSIHDEILPILGRRNWSLLKCNASEMPFFTSDNPIFLGKKESLKFQYYGVGTAQTEMIFPLSPTVCLYGSFEDDIDPLMFANNAIVRSINERTYDRAMRIVISNTRSSLEEFSNLYLGSANG